MQSLHDIWQFSFLGNPVRDWTFALAAFGLTFTLLPLVKRFFMAQRRRLERQQHTPWGMELALLLIGRTSRVFLWVVALYVGDRFLATPAGVERALTAVIVIAFWIQVGLWGSAAVRFALGMKRDRAAADEDRGLLNSLDIVMFAARVLIFAVVLLLALSNLGVNISALLAGLGIGGIAIALAVQTVLGDLLASISIAIDKPFVIGDWLRIDDAEGHVEHIGIKSTRLRSVSGEQIIIANADILKSRVRNLGRMAERRALFRLGVAYETSKAKLDLLPQIVREVVQSVPGTRFEHCLFGAFGQSSLDFEVCFFVPNPHGRQFAEVLDVVNRRIHAAFEDAGIEFAYPTRTVHVRMEPAAAAATPPASGAAGNRSDRL